MRLLVVIGLFLSSFCFAGAIEVKKDYYPNGRLKKEATYVNGKQNGYEKLYYESGNLRAYGEYLDGKLNGIVKMYFDDGKTLKSKFTYINGDLNGIAKEFYPDGKVKKIIKFKDNAVIAKPEFFDDNSTDKK